MVVIDVFTRRSIGFGVERGDIHGVAVCRMFNHAIAKHTLPKYVSTDNDPLFRFHRWLANLRILDIEELKAVPFVPQSHPFVERVIGTLRREYLDHIFFWNGTDLERRLLSYCDYYNQHRCHTGLNGETPNRYGTKEPATHATLDAYGRHSHCHGMFQLPVAARKVELATHTFVITTQPNAASSIKQRTRRPRSSMPLGYTDISVHG